MEFPHLRFSTLTTAVNFGKIIIISSSSSYLFAPKHNKHKHTRKQRQVAREAQTPINAGRPYN